MRNEFKLFSCNRSLAPVMQKILIILTVVLSLAAASLGYLNHRNFLKERGIKEQKIAELDSTKKTLSKTSNDLKESDQKVALLSSDGEKKSADILELNSAKTKLTDSLADIQKQLADKDSSLTQLKTDMAAKDTHITDLEAKANSTIKPANDQTIELKKQLEEKDILTTSLQAKLKDKESQIAALKEREDQRRSKSMRSGLEGRILAVNPSWNFVVLSLGDRNGVVNSAEMLIKRGSQLIGKVRITSVEPSTSIADIVVNSVRAGLSVQPGDTVIYSGPGDDSSDNKLNL